MTVAVRYYSRSGNTKLVADAIAEAAGVRAVSVDTDDAAINEPVDVLFVGGALYAYGLDKHLRDWLRALDGTKVKRAVVFSTSWISRHTEDLIKKELDAKGVAVNPDTFYVKNKANDEQLREAHEFARTHLQA